MPACPYGVLKLIDNSRIPRYFKTEDVLTKGSAMCMGCQTESILRFTFKVLGKNTVIFTPPGCVMLAIAGFGTFPSARLPIACCLLDNSASVMTGVHRYYKTIGKEVNLVAFVGDGATADIGLQALSGAVERHENVIYICYDNEGYMNTGVQRSGTTPSGAWTTTSPTDKNMHGNEQPGKNVPLMMLFNGASYVATAAIGFLDDYAKKLEKAVQIKDGLSYIHLYAPCVTGWRAPQDAALRIARLAVETNYFPLWEADHGKLYLTHWVKEPKPVSELLRSMGKFSHLGAPQKQAMQKMVDDNYATLKRLAGIKQGVQY